MAIIRDDLLPVRTSDDTIRVRRVVRSWAIELGFSLVEQTKFVTAVSEIARNTMTHGGGGTARLESLHAGVRRGLRVTFEDNGPGIPDVALALTDGFATGPGLGLGLGGAKRLSSEFEIDSRAGEGTKIVLTRWR